MDSIDWRAWALAYVGAHNPEAISLAAQLLGVPPCPVCGYRREYCRCNQTKTMGQDKDDGIAVTKSPTKDKLTSLVMEEVEQAANVAYTTYCTAVGGKAFNGDPLPTWEEIMVQACADEKKAKVVAGWRESAKATVSFALGKFLIRADEMLMKAVDSAKGVSEPASSEATTTPAPQVPVASVSQ